MKWQVSIRKTAMNDIRAACDWYEDQRVGLGDEFYLEVADTMLGLELAADRYPVYYKDFRRVITRRFPYKVFFRIDGDAVVVFRVIHAARDHRRELN